MIVNTLIVGGMHKVAIQNIVVQNIVSMTQVFFLKKENDSRNNFKAVPSQPYMQYFHTFQGGWQEVRLLLLLEASLSVLGRRVFCPVCNMEAAHIYVFIT